MDGAKVFVVLVDDDGEMDAQVCQSQQDAQTYCVELVLDYLKQNPHLDEEDSGLGWTEYISTYGDTLNRYLAATEFLNDCGIEDLGVLIVERHIIPKEYS